MFISSVRLVLFLFLFYGAPSAFSLSEKCTVDIAGTRIDYSLYRWLREHGTQTLSYSQFQPGLRHFESENGLVAHEQQLLKTLVLGDPLTSAETLPTLLNEFFQSHPNPLFCAITRSTAEELAGRGWLINEFAQEMRLHIPTYTLEGDEKRKLRTAWNKFKRENHQVVEWTHEEPASVALAKEVTELWRADKEVSDREVRFLTRPIIYGAENDTRRFFVKNADGAVVGLYIFDPLYENGNVIGYSTAFKRRMPNGMTGLEEAFTYWAVEKFREEGMTWLNLGMIPLYQIEDREFAHSRSLHHALRSLANHGDGVVYSIRGQADFKHRFRGEKSPVYLATRNEFNFHGVMAMSKASKLKVPVALNLRVVMDMCRDLLLRR